MNYIKELNVKNLLNSNKDIHWELYPHCNVLGGPNGSGKTIMLDGIEEILSGKERNMCWWCYNSIELTVGDDFNEEFISVVGDRHPESTGIGVVKISSSDLTDVHDKLAALESELWNYENIEDVPEDLKSLMGIINMAFERDKLLITQFDGMMVFNRRTIDKSHMLTADLSLGEQRYLLMLLCAYKSRSNKSTVMLLDMPEIGLHVDLQKNLLSKLLTVNPKMQIICVTHSPSIIKNGWIVVVKEISQLVVGTEESKEDK